jgi:hypothetical protein
MDWVLWCVLVVIGGVGCGVGVFVIRCLNKELDPPKRCNKIFFDCIEDPKNCGR